MNLVSVKTRQEAFDLLEGYAYERKEELNQQRSRRPLVKSFLLETAAHQHAEPSLETLFSKFGCELRRLDDTLFKIYDHKKEQYVGLVEQLIDRHPAIYTTEKSDEMGRWVKKLVASTAALDHLWLSGRIFSELLNTVIQLTPEHRFVRLVFQHENKFEVEDPAELNQALVDKTFDSEDEIDTQQDEIEATTDEQLFRMESDDEFVPESRKTVFSMTDRLRVIKRKLDDMQKLYAPLYSISSLRFPAQGRPGGHDFYFDGKVTNRSNSFADHRQHLEFVLKLYKQATETTERVTWQGVEKTNITTHNLAQTFVGAPVILRFSESLSQGVFDKFIESTFRRTNSFRLWGNPIILGPSKVHVYGVDRHLWQQLFLEITECQIVAIIPEGTCGNTVHRLVTNVQQYLDPGVDVWVGNQHYSELIRLEPEVRSIYQ